MIKRKILKFILQIPFWILFALQAVCFAIIQIDFFEKIPDILKWQGDVSCYLKSNTPAIPSLFLCVFYFITAFDLKRKSLLWATLFLAVPVVGAILLFFQGLF